MTEDNKNTEKPTFDELEKLIKYTLIRDAKKEMRSWALRYIIIPCLIGALVLAVGGYKGIEGINRYQEELIDQVKIEIAEETQKALNATKQQIAARIKLAYEETEIGAIVNSLIKKNAEALIANQVRMEVKPIITKLEQDQELYSQMVNLNALAIHAESGDKQSFLELRKYMSLPKKEYSQFAERVVGRIQTKYYDMSSIVICGADSVKKYIHSDINYYRIWAVNTVMIETLYNFIPSLISMIESDPDLDVCGAIFRALNQLLESSVDLLDENAVSEFNEMWLQKKQLLGK